MVNIGNVWDRTTAFIGDNMRAILSIAIPGLLLPLAANGVVSGAMQDCSAPMNPAVGGVVGIVLMLPVIWSVLALTGLAVEQAGVTAARKAALGRLPQAVGAALIVVAILVVALLPLMLTGGNGPSLMNACAPAAVPDANPNWMRPVYGIAWLLVAVFVAARLTLLYPVIVAEGGVIGALRRAWQLSGGIVWKLIGVWILFQVVKIIAELAAASAFGIIAKIVAPSAGPFAVSSIIVAIIVACVGVAFWIIFATFTALLYREVTGQGARSAT